MGRAASVPAVAGALGLSPAPPKVRNSFCNVIESPASIILDSKSVFYQNYDTLSFISYIDLIYAFYGLGSKEAPQNYEVMHYKVSPQATFDFKTDKKYLNDEQNLTIDTSYYGGMFFDEIYHS